MRQRPPERLIAAHNRWDRMEANGAPISAAGVPTFQRLLKSITYRWGRFHRSKDRCIYGAGGL